MQNAKYKILFNVNCLSSVIHYLPSTIIHHRHFITSPDFIPHTAREAALCVSTMYGALSIAIIYSMLPLIRGLQKADQFSSNRIAHSKSNSSSVIACIGDSLTVGLGSTGEKFRHGYPAVLHGIPPFRRYNIHNYGENGMTVTKATEKFSYWETLQFAQAISCKPSIVVIMFGTNDAKTKNWNESAFRKDYIELIEIFKKLPSEPTVYISIPPPLYADAGVFNIDPYVVNVLLPRIIPEIANTCEVKVIDNFNALGGSARNFTGAYIIDKSVSRRSDMCHLNNLGYVTIAHNVASVLKADM